MTDPNTITVVTQSAPDFTGPAIGLLGVALGSILGLTGIRWQHDAQRAYDVRRLCAGFIHDGEYIRDTYLSNANGMHPDAVEPFLQGLQARSDEMTRTQRHLELIAPTPIDVAAHRYWLSCVEFVDIADRRYGFRPVATQEQLIDANLRWQETRDALIQELRPQPNKTRLTNPIRAWIGRAKTKSELKKFTERGTPQ